MSICRPQVDFDYHQDRLANQQLDFSHLCHPIITALPQVLAFSATYTAGLLGDLEPLMKRPQKVLLCEETVSLQGIRQFYRLVSGPEEGSLEQPAGSHAASSTAANMQQQEQDQPQQPPPPQHQQLQQLQAPKQQSSRGEPQPETDVPLRAPEDDESLQRRLLSKVAALLEVLSRVSFHQVSWTYRGHKERDTLHSNEHHCIRRQQWSAFFCLSHLKARPPSFFVVP